MFDLFSPQTSELPFVLHATQIIRVIKNSNNNFLIFNDNFKSKNQHYYWIFCFIPKKEIFLHLLKYLTAFPFALHSYH